MTHKRRKAVCPVCTANALSKSHLIFSARTGDAYNFYREMSDSDLRDKPADRALYILIGKINSSARYLDDHLFTYPFEFEAYISMARNMIEKLALLNFVLEKEERAASLGELYEKSSFDILTLFSENRSDIDSLISEWKSDNSWSNSEVSHRIDFMGDKELKLIYAYTSRLIHGLNRDEMLGSDEDILYPMAYVYLSVLRSYHAVLSRLPNGLYPRSINAVHAETVKDVDDIWLVSEVPMHSILELTLYGLEHVSYSRAQKEFIIEHNARAMHMLEKQVFVSYVGPDGKHYHGTEGFLEGWNRKRQGSTVVDKQ